MYQTHLSSRDIPLVYNRPPGNRPVLTVENYLKWYDLYLVNPDGTISTVNLTEELLHKFEEKFNESAYCDHVFNPKLVQFLADELNYDLCDQSLEILIGRWELEYKNNYQA